MKKISILFFFIPLFSWAKCQGGDRMDFLKAHSPNNSCKSDDSIEFCLEIPRIIDDKLYGALISFDTNLLNEVSENVVFAWPKNSNKENEKISRTPPDTFIIIDNALRMDLTRRTVFVSCTGKYVYLRDSGGLVDKWNWYGPISIDEIEKYHGKNN